MEDSIPQTTTSLVPSSTRQSLMGNFLLIRLIPQDTIYQLCGALVRAPLHVRIFLQATTVQVPIRYRERLHSNRLQVSLIPIRHKRLLTLQLNWSATELTSTW